jgi:hypothetical protein
MSSSAAVVHRKQIRHLLIDPDGVPAGPRLQECAVVPNGVAAGSRSQCAML